MLPRLTSVLAVLFSASAVLAQAAEAAADPYVLKAYGATSLHSVSWVDHVWFDTQRGRNVPARIYYPTGGTNSGSVGLEKFPVIIFSTGLGRSRDDCAYLGRHWAGCGYVSIHVQHKGSDEEVRQGNLRPRKELQRAFYDPENIRNRPMDVIFVIDQLDQMQRERNACRPLRFDPDRRGWARFRRQTVLGIAGQVLPGHISFAEPRVKAVVAMGTPVPLGQVPLELAYGDIAMPCLHITGTADNSIVATTQASQRRLPFDHTFGADQYLITFYGADHLTYSGHNRPANAAGDALFHRLIAECSTVFWDAYLKDDAGAKAWLADEPLRTHLHGAGRVEKKLMP